MKIYEENIKDSIKTLRLKKELNRISLLRLFKDYLIKCVNKKIAGACVSTP